MWASSIATLWIGQTFQALPQGAQSMLGVRCCEFMATRSAKHGKQLQQTVLYV